MNDADMVKTAVERLGTQVALAERCRVSQPTIASWIARGRIPRWHRPVIEGILAEQGSQLLTRRGGR